MQTQTEKASRSAVHALTPKADCADRGRQAFVCHVKRKLGQMANNGLQDIARVRSQSSAPTREQTEAALIDSPAFAAWTALSKGSQRQMWTAMQDMIARQSDALASQAKALGLQDKRGSLELDPNFEMPNYLLATAFHGQPGGYVDSRGDDDIRAGALQESGGTLYTRGLGSGASDSKARAVVHHLSERFPDLAPRRVLDMGCGYGGQTCGYSLAYPDAKTHAIDAGEGVLRYGHLRAESMSVELHLHQQNAAKTTFPDGHFDLIVSNILLHEVPTDVMQQVMSECYRLLAPRGVVVHQDVPSQKPGTPGYRQFLTMWQTHHNDEPFWEDFASSDIPAALQDAGFSNDAVFVDYIAQIDGPMQWYLVGAQKA